MSFPRSFLKYNQLFLFWFFIKTSERFIHDHTVWFSQQCPQDRYSPAHSSTQFTNRFLPNFSKRNCFIRLLQFSVCYCFCTYQSYIRSSAQIFTQTIFLKYCTEFPVTYPLSGISSPKRSRISVVFPHPDLPLIQVVFPSGKTQHKSLSICCSPYALLTWSTFISISFLRL